jgi:hypothetical protein
MDSTSSPMSAPFGHVDYTGINKSLRELAQAKAALDTATTAGIDCGEWPGICQDLIAKFEQLKSTYFPSQP